MGDGGWETQTRAVLVEECRTRGLPVSGSKAELVARLAEHVDQPAASPAEPVEDEQAKPAVPEQPGNSPVPPAGPVDGTARVDGDRMTRTYPAGTNPRAAREQFVTDAAADGFEVPGGWPTVRRATRQTSAVLTLTATVRRKGA